MKGRQRDRFDGGEREPVEPNQEFMKEQREKDLSNISSRFGCVCDKCTQARGAIKTDAPSGKDTSQNFRIRKLISKARIDLYSAYCAISEIETIINA